MKLNELNELWGLELHSIDDKIKIHNLLTWIIILVDIIVMAILIYFMYMNDVDFVSYTIVMLMVSFASMFAYSYITKPLDNRVYIFYQRHKNWDLKEVTYNIDAQKLYSLVYCLGRKKLKPDKDIDYYEEALINYCYNDYVYAKKFCKLADRYKSEEGNFKAYIIKKNKTAFFIKFADNNSENLVDTVLVEEDEENGDN